MEHQKAAGTERRLPLFGAVCSLHGMSVIKLQAFF